MSIIPTIAVLTRNATIPFLYGSSLPFCDAVLYAWHSGSRAGNAVADILYGAVNPGGKLPMLLPRATGQIPICYNHLCAARDCNSYYGRGRSYQDLPDGPLFPFGFGLSYTTFERTNFKAAQTALPLSKLQAGQSGYGTSSKFYSFYSSSDPNYSSSFYRKPAKKYKSSSKTSSKNKKRKDPYNAKDYYNAEDFYDEHYDDFFDYYDAEDYFNDHQ